MRVRPLKSLVDPARPITYGIVQAGDDVDGGVPYIRPVDMDGHRGVAAVSLRTTSPEIARAYERSSLRPGDVVVSIGPSFGKTLIVPPELAGANLTQGTARIAPRDGVEPRFLIWALQSSLATSFWEMSVGGATFRALNLGPLAQTPVPDISTHDQQAVADYLDRETAKIDTLIAKQHALIATALERRRAVVAAAVSSGVAGSKTVDFNHGWPSELPKGWRRTSVREVVRERVEFNIGAADQRYLSLMANVGVIPYEEKGAVGNRKPDDLAKCKKVFAGDLVINSMNYQIGSYGLSSLDGVCSPVYVVLVPREGSADTAYVARLFEAQPFQKLAQSYGNGILEHRRAISWSTLKNLPINLPPVNEQRSIASFIDRVANSIDELVQTAQRHIELANERRAALITAAVTGQIDVRGETA